MLLYIRKFPLFATLLILEISLLRFQPFQVFEGVADFRGKLAKFPSFLPSSNSMCGWSGSVRTPWSQQKLSRMAWFTFILLIAHVMALPHNALHVCN